MIRCSFVIHRLDDRLATSVWMAAGPEGGRGVAIEIRH